MTGPWSAEFWRIAAGLVAALLIGWLSGHVLLALLLALTLYVVLNLRNLFILEHWLREGRGIQPPEAFGIWGEVYHHLFQLQKRNRGRKRKLKNYLRRFRESTAATPDATVVLGRQGEIEWWNDAAARLLGLRAPQDYHQRLVNLLRFPVFTDFLARGDYTGSIDIASPIDPEVTLNVRVVPYGNNKRLLVARDVSRLNRLEQMRRDFIANVSHELRTPLTVISGFLETMADSDEDMQRKWGRSLTLMTQQSQRMQRLVEDLLLLSRLESGDEIYERKRVNVPEMLREIHAEATALSGDRQHLIHLDAEAGLCMIGSERELRSAFSNLVFNAVQYTPAHGEISLHWYRDTAGLHFEVHDSGDGIAPQHLPRLTERFYRVDVGRSRERGGTGLGLAIVKHVLVRHKGSLTVESEPGEGSTFRCDFDPSTLSPA